jgi:hypothetical protein
LETELVIYVKLWILLSYLFYAISNLIQIIKIMTIGSVIKDTIKRSDLLGAATLLRSKGEPFY